MNKKVTLFSAIAQLVAFGLLFIPGVFKYQGADIAGEGDLILTFERPCNFFVSGCPYLPGSFTLLTVITAPIAIAGILVEFNLYLGKKQLPKALNFIQALLIPFMFISWYWGQDVFAWIDYEWDQTGHIDTNILFYIILILELVILVLDILNQLGKIPERKPVQVNVSESSAEEIKKYKELLDSGAITPEKYETKKKQLLEK